MKTNFVIILAGVLWLMSPASRAATQILPGDRANAAGDNTFLPGFTSPGSVQQLYGSANFTTEILITSIAFRADESPAGTVLDSTIPHFTMRMSTYIRPLAQFSGIYENNRGPDDILVFDSPIHWVTRDLPGQVPNPFDLRVSLTTPFRYNPSAGHLLVYFVSDGATVPPSAIRPDFHSHGDENLGRTGTPANGGGILGNLVTQIEFTPVPEPTFATSAFLSLGWLLIRRRRP